MVNFDPDDLPEATQRARAAREALVGKTIAGRYVLRALLGHGGMGAVYEAEHTGIGKRVAIKFVDPEYATDENVVARFAREARAMSAIESAHIVSVFDAGTEDGRPYLVMELLRGEDLGERLRKRRRVPLDEAMHVAAQVLKGLARAHAAGIIHRDLKPDNVFLVKHDTDPLFAKIVDFGISKIERPRANTHPLALTGRGTVLGTPFYMSPEQAQASSDVDGRTDLYSVGAILFECLTGRPPHTGESYEQVILSICMTDAPRLTSFDGTLPPEVESFVARALSRDRDQRFKTAERMLAALHDVAPRERTRVPLDPPSAQTLQSAGVALARTQLDGSGPRDSSPSHPSHASSDAPPAAATRLGVGTLGQAGTGSAASASTSAAARTAPAGANLGGKWSESPPPVQPNADANAITDAQRRERPSKDDGGVSLERRSGSRPSPPAKKPIGTAIVTALFATALGVAVTFGAISYFGKKTDDGTMGNTSPPTPTAVHSVTSSAPLASSVATPPSAEPPASGEATSTTSASGPSPLPRPPGTPTTTAQTGSLPAAGSGKLPPLPRPSATATPRPTSTKTLDINRELP